MTSPERKALLFLAAVGVLGAGARVMLDGRGGAAVPGDRAALAAQLDAVDSARAARRDARRTPKRQPKPRAKSSTTPSVTQLTPGARVDVDVADSAMLDALPGIGPALAARIVADRAERGAFGSEKGLDRVRGIGPSLVKRVSPHVTFSGIPRPTDAADGSASRDAGASATRRKSSRRR